MKRVISFKEKLMERKSEREKILNFEKPTPDKHTSSSDERLMEDRLKDNTEFWSKTKRLKKSRLPHKTRKMRGGFSSRASEISDSDDFCFKISEHYFTADSENCHVCNATKKEPESKKKSTKKQRMPKTVVLSKCFRGAKSKNIMRGELA